VAYAGMVSVEGLALGAHYEYGMIGKRLKMQDVTEPYGQVSRVKMEDNQDLCRLSKKEGERQCLSPS